MAKLAVNGGPKIREDLFPSQNTMDEKEFAGVVRVMNEGRLSGYRATADKLFYGGPEICNLERAWENKFGLISNIACNSATSGLFIACAAIDLKPGDEVIVTPYSMTCSATVPIWFGAKPIFGDIEPDYFCLDPYSVEMLITEKTRAVITVDLFGQPSDYVGLNRVIADAEKKFGYKIYLIADCAQAPGAMYYDDYACKQSDISIFSFNFGKHMSCGEGGIISTDNLPIANKCRLIMNHAESVINDSRFYCKKIFNFSKADAKLIGLNLRMTELQAVIAYEQLQKLDKNIHSRRNNVMVLNSYMEDIPPVHILEQRPECHHSYYALAYLWNINKAEGLHRDKFIDAVKAELTPRVGRDGEDVQINCGYIKPIYMMPYYFKQIYNYSECHPIPTRVVEMCYKHELFLTLYHAPNSEGSDMMYVGEAFKKVWENRDELM